MPLIKSPTNEARQRNIQEMISSGHKPSQAVAAAYANQRDAERHTHDERQKERYEHENRKYGK